MTFSRMQTLRTATQRINNLNWLKKTHPDYDKPRQMCYAVPDYILEAIIEVLNKDPEKLKKQLNKIKKERDEYKESRKITLAEKRKVKSL